MQETAAPRRSVSSAELEGQALEQGGVIDGAALGVAGARRRLLEQIAAALEVGLALALVVEDVDQDRRAEEGEGHPHGEALDPGRLDAEGLLAGRAEAYLFWMKQQRV